MDDEVRRVLLWLVEHTPGYRPGRTRYCNRCGHSPYEHRIDDSLNQDVTDSSTPTRCIYPMPDGPAVQLCDCPDFVP